MSATNYHNILIVDDVPNNIQILGRMLSKEDYAISFATNGARALEMAATEDYDLVLLDILMPGMDGFEICRCLKNDARTREIPVIFMSALTETESKIAGFKAGCVDYVTKPLEVEEVLARVRTHLTLRKMRKELKAHNQQLQQEAAARKQAQEEIRKLNAQLEQRVKKRTAELMTANEQLKNEIAERKQAQDELKRSYQELTDTQAQLIQSAKLASIGEISAGIAHELSQPLFVIRVNTQMMRRDFENNSLTADDMQRPLELIELAANKMTNIANHLKSFSRKSDLPFVTLNVNKVIEDALLMMNQRLRLKEIKIHKELAPDSVSKIQGDANQLGQVILNLITNAMDAIETKRIHVTQNNQCDKASAPSSDRIEIMTHVIGQEKNIIEIMTKDCGSGIPEQYHDKVFDAFFTTKDPDKGTGLGLSISNKIIKDHRGTIEVAETSPAGTTFRITLPAYSRDVLHNTVQGSKTFNPEP